MSLHGSPLPELTFPIRPAMPADVPAIERLIHEAFAGYVPRLGGAWPAPMREDYASLVARGVVEVLDDQRGLAGTLVLVAKADHLLLDTIAIRPERRGSGLGRRLFQHAEERARLSGLREMRLYTAEVMVENIAMYRRCGWVEYDRAAPNGIARVYMRKSIV